MAAIIIGPTTGATSTTTGLTAGAGLSFGVGLILGFSGFTGILFAGSGSLAPTTRSAARNSGLFAGAGILNVTLGGRYLTNPATLPGAGGLSGLTTQTMLERGNAFPGTSSFTVNAAKLISVSLAGAGNLSALLRQNMRESGNRFAGASSLLASPSGALLATVAFAGAGALSAKEYTQ